MNVTPEQVEGASFAMSKRGGYSTEDVDRFLRVVADDMRVLQGRVISAEGVNEDIQAASNDIATLMRDVHSQLGEKRRLSEAEAQQRLREAEREAAGVLEAATIQADTVRQQADRVLGDAQHHAELLRSDGEQRVREQSQEILRLARAELQELLRRKHEILHAFSSLRSDLAGMESTLEAAALSPDALGDDLVDRTLIDLRQSEVAATTSSATTATLTVLPPLPPPPDGPSSGHPSLGTSFFSPPDVPLN